MHCYLIRLYSNTTCAYYNGFIKAFFLAKARCEFKRKDVSTGISFILFLPFSLLALA